MSNKEWVRARRVLVIRLDGMGDLLMTGPAIRALKAAGRDRAITALVSPAGAECARMTPGIDEVLVYEAPWMKGASSTAPVDRAFIERLRTQHYDAAVIFTVFSQNPLPAALMCYLAEIPRRAAHCRENPYQLLTDWVPETEPQERVRHEVRRQLDLVATLGAPALEDHLALTLSLPVRGWAEQYRARAGRPFIVIHPGATAPSRRYPEESYAEVLRTLEEELDAYCVLTGGPAEAALLDRIRSEAHSRAAVMADLSLDKLAALLGVADVVITNNTGPAHVAAAVKAPVVVLYALTNPQHAPWRASSRVLSADVACRNCYRSQCPAGHHRCLRDISPRQVMDAVTELLSEYQLPAHRALC